MLAGTVHIVDDDDHVRETLAAIVAAADLRTATYASAEAFQRDFQDTPGESRCLVADLRMPGKSGLELYAELLAENVVIPAIFVTAYADVSLAVQAMKAGAIDFLEKPLDRHQFIACVRRALTQDEAQWSRRARQNQVHECLGKLTRREREVLELLVGAHSTKEIAARLNINAKTVFVHRARVMEKMNVESLVELSRLMTDSYAPPGIS